MDGMESRQVHIESLTDRFANIYVTEGWAGLSQEYNTINHDTTIPEDEKALMLECMAMGVNLIDRDYTTGQPAKIDWLTSGF